MRLPNVYQDETADRLLELGYSPAFLEDIKGGEEITLLHTEFREHALVDIVEFLKVIKGTVRKYPYSDEDGGGCRVAFIGMNANGATKPISLGGYWGIYLKGGSVKPGKKIAKGHETRLKAHGTPSPARRAPGSRNRKKTGTG